MTTFLGHESLQLQIKLLWVVAFCIERNIADLFIITAFLHAIIIYFCADFNLHFLITAPPRWVIEPFDIEAIEGEKVSLLCHAEGLPQPKYVWRKSESNFFNI